MNLEQCFEVRKLLPYRELDHVRGWLPLIFGAKFGLIAHPASPAPFRDQWNAEAALLYLPYVEERLGLADLLAPHNEHRIFFTRLLNLGLLEIVERWYTISQMVVNAAIHALALIVLIAICARSLAPNLKFITVALAAAAMIPYG